MRRLYFSTALTLTLLAGCATGPTPQNAQEYRQAVSKGGYGTLTEVYEVSGSYAKVAATLNTKSHECFNRVITIQECRGTSCFSHDYTFIPRVKGGAKGTEIVVQIKINPDNNVYIGGRPPESGMYVAVADVAPAGGKTRISMYATDVGMFSHIPKAIKLWANGTNMGCPDFTGDA